MRVLGVQHLDAGDEVAAGGEGEVRTPGLGAMGRVEAALDELCGFALVVYRAIRERNGDAKYPVTRGYSILKREQTSAEQRNDALAQVHELLRWLVSLVIRENFGVLNMPSFVQSQHDGERALRAGR